jgi:hypothetical protein
MLQSCASATVAMLAAAVLAKLSQQSLAELKAVTKVVIEALPQGYK